MHEQLYWLSDAELSAFNSYCQADGAVRIGWTTDR